MEKEAYGAAMKINRDAALHYLEARVKEGRKKEQANNAMMGGMGTKKIAGPSSVGG